MGRGKKNQKVLLTPYVHAPLGTDRIGRARRRRRRWRSGSGSGPCDRAGMKKPHMPCLCGHQYQQPCSLLHSSPCQLPFQLLAAMSMSHSRELRRNPAVGAWQQQAAWSVMVDGGSVAVISGLKKCISLTRSFTAGLGLGQYASKPTILQSPLMSQNCHGPLPLSALP